MLVVATGVCTNYAQGGAPLVVCANVAVKWCGPFMLHRTLYPDLILHMLRNCTEILYKPYQLLRKAKKARMSYPPTVLWGLEI